jgi:hypothetical protein
MQMTNLNRLLCVPRRSPLDIVIAVCAAGFVCGLLLSLLVTASMMLWAIG